MSKTCWVEIKYKSNGFTQILIDGVDYGEKAVLEREIERLKRENERLKTQCHN